MAAPRPIRAPSPGSYSVGNFNNFAGQYNVEEGFAEVDAPFLKDNIVQNLDFDAAGRLTSYSTAGLVETYKLGLTSRVNDDLRLRTTWSLDIRAPNLSRIVQQRRLDLEFGGRSAQTARTCRSTHSREGNQRARTPEIATTISGGVVLTPHWIDGSVHFGRLVFDPHQAVDLHGLRQHRAWRNAMPTRQFLLLRAVGFRRPTHGSPLTSQIDIQTFPQNAASQTVSGLDFQGD